MFVHLNDFCKKTTTLLSLCLCVCVSLCIGWLSDLLIHEDLKKICNMLPPSQPLIHNRQLNQHKSLLNPNSVTAQHVSAPAAETFQTCNMLKVFSASFKLTLQRRLDVGLQPKLLQFRNNKDDHIQLLL